MYIKYVRIQGFKSYRDKVTCGPLSPMHNSIVGMNGSGKSNFFAALRFVLSDAYSNLRPEERAKLLNEGAGPSLVSAYVEIVFDNSDHRLDNEKDEVTIRRQIGLKKDEYFIDNKHVTKQDIANMLETAGFSKSNPYYIVEQGKVTKITEMTDKARLELLKEVAGTNVYEEKKDESLKIMKESDAKMVEIKKNLDMIEERLAKLDAEKEELSQYYALDKERRSLQHSLLSQKIKGYHDEMAGIEHDRQTIRADSTQSETDKQKLEAQLQELDRKIENLQKTEERLTHERAALEEEEKQKLKESYAKAMKVSEIQNAVNQAHKEHDTKARRIKEIQSGLAKVREDLAKLLPSIDSAEAEKNKLVQRYNEVDRELNNLLAIQGNAQQFKSKAERDAHLKNEIKSLEQGITKYHSMESQLKSDIKAAEQNIADCDRQKSALQSEVQKSRDARPAGSQVLKDLEMKRLDVLKQTNEQRRLQEATTQERENVESKLHSLSGSLTNSMPPAAAKALRFLKRFVEQENIRGFHGAVIDLIQCSEQYNTAVEQVGGARLFNIVVDDDNVASQLMNALQRHKEGRTQFLPLSRLRPEMPSWPTNLSGAQPLVQCMRFDAKFKPAMLEIFGRTLLCENYDVAADYRRNLDVACVTLDGDKFSKKGSIKGGYYDLSKSQITMQSQIRKEEANLAKLKAQEKQIKDKISELEQMSAKIQGDHDKLRREMADTSSKVQQHSASMEALRREISDAEETLKGRQIQLKDVTDHQQELESQLMGLKEQLSSSFAQALTADQQQRLKVLTEEHTKLQKQRTSATNQYDSKVQQRSDLENRISANTRQFESLQEELHGLAETAKSNLEIEKLEQSTIEQAVTDCRSQKENKEAELEQAKQELERARKEKKKANDELRKQGVDADSSRKKLDQLLEKKTRLLADIDAAQAQLRELGSLPEAFEKYKSRSAKQLMDDLHKVTEKLKAFKDVNKKALDQFNQFTEQREKFRDRRDELDRGADSIRELITKLDEKKDEAIQNTFRMVAKNFKDVFARLVPGGSGELIMKTSDRNEDDEDDEGDAEPAGRRGGSRLRTYVGVSVKVRFAAGGEVQLMRSLSGGQKTVVALGIIFAIQKCDPAPFYLFDEVDANLDPMYRAALAAMISKQKTGVTGTSQAAEPVQFITSSFQPELAQVADSHWLTTHSGMSRIVKGTLDDQIAIIKENQKTMTAAQPA